MVGLYENFIKVNLQIKLTWLVDVVYQIVKHILLSSGSIVSPQTISFFKFFL